MAVDPNDPDAALHAAQPGKFKPSSAAAPAPSSPANEPGTLSDTVERYGSPLSTTPITQPLDKEQSWGEWLAGGWDHFSAKVDAGETLQLGDNSLGYTNALRKGYKPIVEMLGGDPLKDNPGHYDVSKWADPELGHFLTGDLRSREDQEQRLAEQIRARRLKEPGFAPGVPDDPKKLRAYVMAADTKEREAAQATIAQGGAGLGTLAAQGYGSFKGSLADPAVISTFPIGGGGKTLLQVVGREALVNGAIAAAALPGEARNRDDRGEAPLTFGEGAAQVAGGALLGSVIGAGVHGAGKALEATGLPQKLASTIGNLDIANTVSYKIYSALPERLQNKWGAGIVTKWAHRLAAGEKLEDVFSNLSNVELATLSRTVVGEPHLSPEERAAAEHLTRNEEIGDASPYEAGPTGDAKHEEQLGGAVDSIINGKPVEESPSAPLTGSGATGSPDAPARPPAALSTAERPQIDEAALQKEWERKQLDRVPQDSREENGGFSSKADQALDLWFRGGLAWSDEDQRRAIHLAMDGGRPDIAHAIVQRAERIADRAEKAKPGFDDPDHPKYAAVAERLAERGREARALATEFAATVDSYGSTGAPDAPAATSSEGRRPLRFAIAHNLPMDIVDGLKARGIPDHIARGAAAGAFAESGGRLEAVNPKSGAMGFGQWLGSRKDELIRRYGPNPTHEQQLDFLAWELKGGDHGGKSVLAARDEVEALHHYIKDFMRPAAGAMRLTGSRAPAWRRSAAKPTSSAIFIASRARSPPAAPSSSPIPRSPGFARRREPRRRRDRP
jgi:hypothetical protein